MDFDEFYRTGKTDTEKNNSVKQFLYDFGKSKLTLYLVILIWLGIALSMVITYLINQIDITQYIDITQLPNNPGTTTTTSFGVPSVIGLILELLIPFGMLVLYLGSKKNNSKEVKLGLNFLKIYFVVNRVFVYIACAIMGLGVLLILLAEPLVAIIFGAIVGSLLYLYIYFLNKFIEFFRDLESIMNNSSKFYPSAKPLKTPIIIMFVLTLASVGLFFLMGFWFEVLFTSPYLDAYGVDLSGMVDYFNDIMIYSYIGIVLSAIQLGYTLFYLIKLNNFIEDANREIEVQLQREAELERQRLKESNLE
jgi:hypothetical protein